MPEILGEISVDAILFIEVRDRAYKYKIKHTVTTIGSAQDNIVRIKEPSVEDHHVIITYVDGKFFVRRVADAPLRLDGALMERITEELGFGSVMRMGDVFLKFVEGTRVGDVALMAMVYPNQEETVRPFILFLTRKTESLIGDPPSDLALPGSERVGVESYGADATYIAPPRRGAKIWLNEELVVRRVPFKDNDILRIPGYTIKLKILKGEVMDDVEGLLWPEAMSRYSVGRRRFDRS